MAWVQIISFIALGLLAIGSTIGGYRYLNRNVSNGDLNYDEPVIYDWEHDQLVERRLADGSSRTDSITFNIEDTLGSQVTGSQSENWNEHNQTRYDLMSGERLHQAGVESNPSSDGSVGMISVRRSRRRPRDPSDLRPSPSHSSTSHRRETDGEAMRRHEHRSDSECSSLFPDRPHQRETDPRVRRRRQGRQSDESGSSSQTARSHYNRLTRGRQGELSDSVQSSPESDRAHRRKADSNARRWGYQTDSSHASFNVDRLHRRQNDSEVRRQQGDLFDSSQSSSHSDRSHRRETDPSVRRKRGDHVDSSESLFHPRISYRREVDHEARRRSGEQSNSSHSSPNSDRPHQWKTDPKVRRRRRRRQGEQSDLNQSSFPPSGSHRREADHDFWRRQGHQSDSRNWSSHSGRMGMGDEPEQRRQGDQSDSSRSPSESDRSSRREVQRETSRRWEDMLERPSTSVGTGLSLSSFQSRPSSQDDSPTSWLSDQECHTLMSDHNPLPEREGCRNRNPTVRGEQEIRISPTANGQEITVHSSTKVNIRFGEGAIEVSLGTDGLDITIPPSVSLTRRRSGEMVTISLTTDANNPAACGRNGRVARSDVLHESNGAVSAQGPDPNCRSDLLTSQHVREIPPILRDLIENIICQAQPSAELSQVGSTNTELNEPTPRSYTMPSTILSHAEIQTLQNEVPTFFGNPVPGSLPPDDRSLVWMDNARRFCFMFFCVMMPFVQACHRD